ncbi:MAG: hypothetical protein UR99_C0052G0001 [Candidatus Moranbacteria bacterium GW2011_GWD2_36_12]|nr:MAG: hypothetical protein UR99_C0052G0001 [Candidatus Moranbacteria bacterium GW2011_GWD2_36_12]KKQ04602.1 MAG: hypothetical protein US16_C0053G0001 [Candidatus Moranbacteria bacterium GW2011_GWE2_36_40]
MIEFKESHRHKLVVSADDFGISMRANKNILYLIELGKIDRVGVMINGEISQEEVSKLSRCGVKIDIHLDILHEFADQRQKKKSGPIRSLEFLKKLLFREITSKKVFADWNKQIEKFRKIFGKNPDGINSHEHIHLFPFFFKIALDLRDKYSIPFIRFGDSVFMPKHGFVSHTLHYLRKMNLRTCSKRGCVSTSSLVSLDWIDDVDNFIDNLPEGNIEVVCHPEIADDFIKIKKYF